MPVNERRIDATPEQVWDVLADGWLYPVWVVGATRMREVDSHWPDSGARIHHSTGVWPLVINDESVVLSAEPPRRLRLRAKVRPAGEAEVLMEVEPSGSGSVVRISEDAVAGPGKLVPKVLRAPVLEWRNSETLRRLAYVAEGRARR